MGGQDPCDATLRAGATYAVMIQGNGGMDQDGASTASKDESVTVAEIVATYYQQWGQRKDLVYKIMKAHPHLNRKEVTQELRTLRQATKVAKAVPSKDTDVDISTDGYGEQKQLDSKPKLSRSVGRGSRRNGRTYDSGGHMRTCCLPCGNSDGQLTYSQEVWRCMQEYLDGDVMRLLVEQLKQHPVVARRACHVRLTDNFLLETVKKFSLRVPVVHPGRVTLWLLKPKEDWVPRGMDTFKAADRINLLGQRVVTEEVRQWDHVTNTLVLDRISINRHYTRAQHDKLDRILAELGIVGIKSKGIRTKIKAIMEWAPLAWSRRIGNTPVNLSTDMTGAEVYAQFPSPNAVRIEYKARDRDPWQVMPRDDTSLRSLGIMRKSARFKKSNTGATVV